MNAYDKSYLNEIVETQGKLFDEVSEYEPGIDVGQFIQNYMKSKTRSYIDHGQAYVCTLNSRELWDYFCKTDQYMPVKGEAIKGFSADWIGQFYAYFQWYYNIASKKVLELVPLDFIRAAYLGLHDLDLELAVRKVGDKINEQASM
jgi:hypothetical protein